MPKQPAPEKGVNYVDILNIPPPPTDTRLDYMLISKRGNLIWVPVATRTGATGDSWDILVGGPIPEQETPG